MAHHRPSKVPIEEARKNALLRLLPQDVWAMWRDELDIQALKSGDIVQEPGSPLHYVYFPISCVISVMHALIDGASVQVAVVGHEGLIGAPAFLGHATAGTRAIVQCTGLSARVPADRVIAEFKQGGAVMALLLRCVQASTAQMAQMAVCNRHHTPEQQFCRWLLMTLDRVEGNGIDVTQELIAAMLGVRRETVNEAARKLQARGIIEVRRGHVALLDRAALERCACECYGTIRQAYASLFSRLVDGAPGGDGAA